MKYVTFASDSYFHVLCVIHREVINHFNSIHTQSFSSESSIILPIASETGNGTKSDPDVQQEGVGLWIILGKMRRRC